MKRWISMTSPLLALAAGASTLCPVAAESISATSGQAASARLALRVTIPPMVKLQEDIHPLELATGVAKQKLVIQTTLRQGFCAALRLAATDPIGWELRVASGNDVWLQPTGEGYRLCSNGPGQHTVYLEHRFDTSAAPGDTPRAWPVRMEIASI